jgi:hypothetical protein
LYQMKVWKPWLEIVCDTFFFANGDRL